MKVSIGGLSVILLERITTVLICCDCLVSIGGLSVILLEPPRFIPDFQ